MSHEFSQNVLLLLLIAAGLTHLLLALIVHHLLNHAAGRPVQITEFAVLGLNLRSVDFGCRGYDVGPPFHLVGLVEVNGQLLAGGGGFECPGAVVDENGVWEGALRGAGLEGAEGRTIDQSAVPG